MKPESAPPPWIELERLLEQARQTELEAFLETLSPRELALCVSRLDDDRRARLLAAIGPDDAAAVVEQIPEVQAVDAIEMIEPETAAAILHELHDADRVDLLSDMEHGVAEAILDAMTDEEAETTRALRDYAKDVAGGLMTREYLSFVDSMTVDDLLADLRANASNYRDYVVQYIFVTLPDGRLTGVLRLHDLLFAAPSRTIRELMIPNPLSLRGDASLNDVRTFFDRHPLYGVPVVDDQERLIGMIRRAAMNEALTDRSDAAFLKTQGIVGGEELRSMPILQRSRRRLAWLSVNIALNVVAASVIAMHQETLAAVIALAVFLPIISDMSGCSGNQAVAVSMRELSLGLLRPSEVGRVWLKEVSVGWINGLALGGLLALVAWAWKGNPYLGLVAGAALMLNTVVAVSIGGTVPLLLRRLGMDPALASGPILTTVTDVCGFLLLLGIASAMLPLLT